MSDTVPKNKIPIRCTIKDVAREANVSITTVSAVLRNTENIIIGEETKKRVFAVAEMLNYHTNYFASKLRSKQTYVIGFMVPYFSMPILNYKIEGLIRALEKLNYSTIIRCSFDTTKNEEQYYREFLSMGVDALIIASCSPQFAQDDKDFIKNSNIPIISLELTAPAKSDIITVDRVEGFYLLTKYLISLGHKNIGLLTPKVPKNILDDETIKLNARFIGYNNAIKEAGIEPNRSLIQELEIIEQNHVKESALAIIKRNPDMTALVVSDDACAFTTIHAAQSLGLNVPDDLSVTGFDNVVESEYANVPLTTMAQPVDLLVEKTVELLLERITNKAILTPQFFSFAPQLIVRKSTSTNKKS
jgi:DNA-binding LacI/PurR family transcriptional regulator